MQVAAAPPQKHVFVFGLGYVGAGLASYLKHLQDDDTEWVVNGTTRSSASKQELNCIGMEAFQFSSSESGLSDEIQEALQKSTHVLSTVGPSIIDQNNSKDPVLDAVERCDLELGSIEWMGYISSTGVYGDWDGDWVDERSSMFTQTGRGKARIAAENQWREFSTQRNLQLDVFRLGGIYGPGRNLFEALSSKNLLSSQSRRLQQRYTNRCHLLDVCRALHSAMIMGDAKGNTYNVVDDNPAPRSEVQPFAQSLLKKDPARFRYDKFPAQKSGIPQRKEKREPDRKSNLTSVASRRTLEEKRVRNDKVKALMQGLEFPTCVEGLTAIWQGDFRPFSYDR
ncbi:hypothetical protein BSKO_11200 [Bryopsis sp. KO-2023]|nr:hypothetical protein BSKO_11200 [Bryopsis sp. KO-2023]